MDWLAAKHRDRRAQSRALLAGCCAALQDEIKLPLNVSCSGIARGILTRKGAVVRVQGTAEVHGKHLAIQSAARELPQLVTLVQTLDRAVFELELGRAEEAQAFLRSALDLLEVPPRALRFPEKFAVEAQGVCSEVFVCEKWYIVATVYAYQDAPQQYRATDSASAKCVDPVLMDIATKIEDVLRM